MGPSRVVGQQLAFGRPEESWQPTTLSSSTFHGQNIQFTVPEAGVISEDRWPPHLQTQHPLQDTKNSWKMTWSARRGIHTWPTFKSRVAQTCRQQTKHSKCFIWFRWQAIISINGLVYWRIYAPFGLNKRFFRRFQFFFKKPAIWQC